MFESMQRYASQVFRDSQAGIRPASGALNRYLKPDSASLFTLAGTRRPLSKPKRALWVLSLPRLHYPPNSST